MHGTVGQWWTGHWRAKRVEFWVLRTLVCLVWFSTSAMQFHGFVTLFGAGPILFPFEMEKSPDKESSMWTTNDHSEQLDRAFYACFSLLAWVELRVHWNTIWAKILSNPGESMRPFFFFNFVVHWECVLLGWCLYGSIFCQLLLSSSHLKWRY